MKKRVLFPVVAILLISADAAQACGRRCGCRRGHARVVAVQQVFNPAVSYYVYPTSYVASTVPKYPDPDPIEISQGPRSGGVQPLYSYDSIPDDNMAYYYTYDDSGKLVIRQWMDWLFRGGRRAGMPAPPLPIVGRLNNP
jgi:hypothetical protein